MRMWPNNNVANMSRVKEESERNKKNDAKVALQRQTMDQEERCKAELEDAFMWLYKIAARGGGEASGMDVKNNPKLGR